jgi:hypothetical protein
VLDQTFDVVLLQRINTLLFRRADVSQKKKIYADASKYDREQVSLCESWEGKVRRAESNARTESKSSKILLGASSFWDFNSMS